MAKPRVAVFFGGMSSEHDVSLQSAASVIRNIPQDKYEVICVGITKKGRWLYYPGSPDRIASGEWRKDPDCCRAILSPDPTQRGLLKLMEDGQSILLKVDVLFPVLHGKNGEDGSIQGLFRLSGIPYVGSDVLGSANCMDKEFTHIVLTHAGIPNARFEVVRHIDASRLDERCAEIGEKLGFPLFVKPANAGSSVGVNKAKTPEDLKAAVRFAFTHDRKVIVEEAIVGKEVECAVLGNEKPATSICGQIIPCNEFYDYDAKYLSAASELKIPADIPEETAKRVQETALKAYRALGCAGLARIDFFVTDDGEVILNEPNTMPGFTNISMYPKLWAASGIPYSELIDRLITLAIARGEQA